MPNYLRLAAKQLIIDAAKQHAIKPTQLLKIFNHEIAGYSRLVSFAQGLAGCNDPSVRAFIEGTATTFVVPNIRFTRADEADRYQYLFHTIDNLWYRKARHLKDITFYPRIEDLFGNIKSKPLDVTEPKSERPTFSTKEIKWNSQQKEAFALVHKWLRSKRRSQIFRLFGYAGTGKTEMSKSIADFVYNEAGKKNVPQGEVLFAAYTGKACSVLRTKGCRGATTLHSLLYKPQVDSETGLIKGFILNGESPISTCGLLIIDEVSMVNAEMAEDILSFGCPVLVLGDPAQLPPVTGEGFFTEAEPDYMLTNIERQAKENPIIYLATRARKGLELKPGKYGESVVYEFGKHVDRDMLTDHDQVICGLNATRRTLNKKLRRIKGFAGSSPIYPTNGDKLMCLKNNKLSGLYNGTLWTSSKPQIRRVQHVRDGEVIEGTVDVLHFQVTSIDEHDDQGKPYVIDTQCPLHLFNSQLPEPAYRDIRNCDSFDFGYAATGHKTQGSQYASVLMIDESSTFRDQATNHRYTVITRAAERLTIVL
jgi:exodeoxyribonuclease-5